MSHTYSIDHANASTESVLVEVAEKSYMTLQSTDVDPKTGDILSTYVLATGDASYPATVTYRVQNQTQRGKPVRRIVVTLNTWATDDDGLGLVLKEPISSSFSMVIPASFTIELADLDDFIGNMFSFLYASQSAGARNTGYLQKLLYGVPQVV